MKHYFKKIGLLFILLLSVATVSCGKSGKETAFTGAEEDLEHTIYICSDLHLLADSLIPEDGDKSTYTTDGRIQAYDHVLVQALVDKVNADRPDALILTGDLSYNGELDSHKELVEMLDTIDKSVRVLVIPGNHDTYILGGLVTDCSTIDESFRILYKDYGYTGAVSYDEATLSYAWEMDDDLLFLMIDTTLNRYNEEEGRNIIGGYIEGTTYEWMEGLLKTAQDKGQRVICFTHHNAIDHNTGFTSGYTLIDNEDIIDLLTKYGVQLNFSGHLHIQSIASAVSNGTTLYDIASSSLLTYNNTVGELKLYQDGFIYAKESLADDEAFSAMSKQYFMDAYYKKTIASYTEKYGEKGDSVLQFVSECNALYFDGDYTAINDLKAKNKSIIKLIKKKNDKGLPRCVDVENTDQCSLSGYWIR